ncbi:HupE/UreJ family protein [Mucilaginibacter sp. ZT4R22]|uniref:HupE/UreJ family protein n=2 Tax=Mucilaginibacter pankratovii TaxID=2772110 RepID=A0ABR7WRY8_9SPHI|nr:HupE/UreJ family protein [Mucilaginibacter pankratovii]
MPNSVVLLDIKPQMVTAELQLPLNELELAFGHDVNRNSDKLVERLGTQLKAYILQHVHPVGSDGRNWAVSLQDMLVQPVQQSESGPYKELTVHLVLIPTDGNSTRNFTLNYDVIIHQVVSHFALVSVRQDWDNGLSQNHPYQVGVVRMDVPTNKILPLQVNIQQGSLWTGFTAMLGLGMQHIKEGTDHLLFLLTLLLPATLLVTRKQWGQFGGVGYSLVRIFKIVTAFTAGHSVTLLIGATGLFSFPGRPIEILIALSILISAIHAYKPIFPGKEMYIAAGFGLVHGMAFAETLVNLNLDAGRMALSILGFNLGIELMQLFIIAIIIPWLIILSYNNLYKGLRVGGAITAGTASVGWMVERITDKPNIVGSAVMAAAGYAQWLVLILAIAAVFSFFAPRRQNALG